MHWKKQVSPNLVGRGQEEANRGFNDGVNRDSFKFGFYVTWTRTNPWCHWNGGHALRYHTNVIPEGTDLRNAVGFAYGPSFGRNTELSGMHGGEAARDIIGESKQNDNKSSGDSGHENPTFGFRNSVIDDGYSSHWVL